MKRWVKRRTSKKNKKTFSRWEEDYVAPETERVSLFEEYLEMSELLASLLHVHVKHVTKFVLIIVFFS